MFDDDDQHQAKYQIQQNQAQFQAKQLINNRNEEKRLLGMADESEKPGLWRKALSSQGSLISLLSILCSLVYLLHFNFSNGLVRLIYFLFTILYPLVTFGVSAVIGMNLKNKVLREQDKSAENAEFLDFEDDEEDILRKAKVLAVARKVKL